MRPLSRALSVHQGKGASNADAQLGALLEAVESDAAEHFAAHGPVCRIADLPKNERPDDIADFAARRDRPPAAEQAYQWVEAEDLLTGGRLHVPFEVASLDFTRGLPSRFDRASNGLATGATREEALTTALHEIIERDAVIEWSSGGLIRCTAASLRTETVPFDWLRYWTERLNAAGVALSVYSIPSLTGSPVFVCELSERSHEVAAYHLNAGYACHCDPEVALFKALAEAVQGRATYIAGAREDLFWFYRAAPRGQALARFGLPLASGMSGVGWDSIAPGPVGSRAFAQALARAGYPRIAVLDIAEPEGLSVVRAFAYGIGSTGRRRREPA